MTCNNCGYNVSENESFCPQCGTPVVNNDYQTEPSQPVNNNYQPEQSQPVNAPVGQQKSKLAAGLFGIFFGAWGVHNFYLGYTKKAIIQLVVSAVCFVLGFCTVITFIGTAGMAIWGLVEGIMILAGNVKVDGKGVPLKS